jgi:hypothetical protein
MQIYWFQMSSPANRGAWYLLSCNTVLAFFGGLDSHTLLHNRKYETVNVVVSITVFFGDFVYWIIEGKDGLIMDGVEGTKQLRLVGPTDSQSPNFEFLKKPKNRFQGTNSARLSSLACRYDNPISSRSLVSIDCLKIPAQIYQLAAICLEISSVKWRRLWWASGCIAPVPHDNITLINGRTSQEKSRFYISKS